MKCLLVLLLFAIPASAQPFTYRGFGQIQSTLYPQTTHQDDDHVAVEARFRIEPAYRATDWLTFDAETLRATVQGLPHPSDISFVGRDNVNTVIEFMSR